MLALLATLTIDKRTEGSASERKPPPVVGVKLQGVDPEGQSVSGNNLQNYLSDCGQADCSQLTMTRPMTTLYL
jgi:hypothetical protein